MDKELLDLLACPKCKGDLEEDGDGASLRCSRCAIRFPVEDGIPILVLESALPDE
jgi:uncharacterized protein YbaR (Trm112 family)